MSSVVSESSVRVCSGPQAVGQQNLIIYSWLKTPVYLTGCNLSVLTILGLVQVRALCAFICFSTALWTVQHEKGDIFQALKRRLGQYRKHPGRSRCCICTPPLRSPGHDDGFGRRHYFWCQRFIVQRLRRTEHVVGAAGTRHARARRCCRRLFYLTRLPLWVALSRVVRR